VLVGFGFVEEGFGVVDVDEGVFGAAHVEHGALDLVHYAYRFELPQMEIGGLLFPECVLDVLLDRVDDAFEEEGGEEWQVVVTQLVY